MSRCSWFVALAAASFGLAAARDAGAFCRTRTCEFRSDVACPTDDLSGCSQSGAFVYWKSGCISYAVQRDGSPAEGISALDVADLVDQGFRLWSDVACAQGGSPELASSRQGLIACDAVEFNCRAGDQNSNLITFRDNFVNQDFGLQFGVIALTTVTANLVSGQIFDADMEINSRDEDFTLDASGSPDDRRDLRGVINHELGHLLGLSHSKERGALMRALYEGTTTPSSDDTAAICAAMPRGASDPSCSVEPLASDAVCLGNDASCTSIGDSPAAPPSGCALEARSRPVGPTAWLWALGLALGVLRRQSQAGKRVL